MENSILLGVYMSDILHMSVKGLFGHLDYELDFERNDGFSIIAAPNSFGKSSILKAINAVFSGNVFYFASLKFSEISLTYFDTKQAGQETLQIKKQSKKNGYKVAFTYGGNKSSFTSEDIDALENELEKKLKGYKRIGVRGESKMMWRKDHTSKPVYLYDVFDQQFYNDECQKIFEKFIPWMVDFYKYFLCKKVFVTANRFADSFTVELRNRFKVGFGEGGFWQDFQGVGENDFDVESLNRLIMREIFNHDSGYGEEYPPEFPEISRDISCKEDLYKAAAERWKEAAQLEKRLDRFGFLGEGYDCVIPMECPTKKFKIRRSDNIETLRGALRKLDLFWNFSAKYTQFMDRMELLEETLNKMLFFKKVRVDRKGVHLLSKKGVEDIGAFSLSSGEKQIISLLGLVLFDGVYDNKPVLVISDEPETSLHPAWQEILADFFYEVSRKFNKRFIFACHSPIFIGNRWDKVIDLYKQGMKA